jgi:hypothetical protein
MQGEIAKARYSSVKEWAKFQADYLIEEQREHLRRGLGIVFKYRAYEDRNRKWTALGRAVFTPGIDDQAALEFELSENLQPINGQYFHKCKDVLLLTNDPKVCMYVQYCACRITVA